MTFGLLLPASWCDRSGQIVLLLTEPERQRFTEFTEFLSSEFLTEKIDEKM